METKLKHIKTHEYFRLNESTYLAVDKYRGLGQTWSHTLRVYNFSKKELESLKADDTVVHRIDGPELE